MTPDTVAFCEACKTNIPLPEIIPDAVFPLGRCPVCNFPLVTGDPTLVNPALRSLSIPLLGFIARMIVNSGALEVLETRVLATKNKIDDAIGRGVVAFIKALAGN